MVEGERALTDLKAEREVAQCRVRASPRRVGPRHRRRGADHEQDPARRLQAEEGLDGLGDGSEQRREGLGHRPLEYQAPEGMSYPTGRVRTWPSSSSMPRTFTWTAP